MSREQYEAQFNSLSKAFSKAKRRSAAGGATGEASSTSSAGGKSKGADEMAHFVGMLMDLVGVFNKEDKMLDKSLPLDDPRMTFSMIFGGGKGLNMTGEEEEWSTDEDEGEGDSEPEDASPAGLLRSAPALTDEGLKPATKPKAKATAPAHPPLPATTLPAEGRKVTEAEAEATAEELAAAESARERRKLKNAKKKADKKKRLREKKEVERMLKAGMQIVAGEDPTGAMRSEQDDEDDREVRLFSCVPPPLLFLALMPTPPLPPSITT